ncbi:methylenetetrahydrofolate reductase [Acetivibrio saccincola]|uniref:methylenetetrahydrofolate reductase n=1 Tax=Acetivibrio saccincola TaxID=1677857 RepID=UPI002683AE6C
MTYSAGGSESNTDTFKIASAIKNNYGIESVAHLPSINHTKGEVLKMLEDLRTAGIENILALRGDVNPSFSPKNDFKFASDLISFKKNMEILI